MPALTQSMSRNSGRQTLSQKEGVQMSRLYVPTHH